MRCLHCYSSPIPLLLPSQSLQLKLSSATITTHSQVILGPSPSQTRTSTKAIATSLVLAATSKPMSPDTPVLLQTGGLLVFIFWFFNFFLTDRISEYFGFDKVGEEEEDQNTTDGSSSAVEEPNEPTVDGKASSATKKQGLGKTRTKKTKTKT